MIIAKYTADVSDILADDEELYEGDTLESVLIPLKDKGYEFNKNLGFLVKGNRSATIWHYTHSVSDIVVYEAWRKLHRKRS